MCELCQAEHVTTWYYEDDVCWVADCSTHRSKKLCVLKRHTSQPTEEELKHMHEVMEKLFPGIRLRGPRSILDHFHLHQE